MTDVTYTRVQASDVPDLLDELCEVYADAYGQVQGEDAKVKTSAFRDRATSAPEANNYELVIARAGDEPAGFVFGYEGWGWLRMGTSLGPQIGAAKIDAWVASPDPVDCSPSGPTNQAARDNGGADIGIGYRAG